MIINTKLGTKIALAAVSLQSHEYWQKHQKYGYTKSFNRFIYNGVGVLTQTGMVSFEISSGNVLGLGDGALRTRAHESIRFKIGVHRPCLKTKRHNISLAKCQFFENGVKNTQKFTNFKPFFTLTASSLKLKLSVLVDRGRPYRTSRALFWFSQMGFQEKS
jgi:hypothetical protein